MPKGSWVGGNRAASTTSQQSGPSSGSCQPFAITPRPKAPARSHSSTTDNITVFAPTNDAFAALPAGTVENLLLPENREQLSAILTYHVVPSKVMAADVSSGDVPTLNGTELTIDVADGTVTVGGAEVIATDVKASNGVIHVVNRVILPPTN